MQDPIDLGPVEQIPIGGGREFTVQGERIAVFRLRDGGGVFAIQADCPHRGASLCDGHIHGKTVACPLHYWTFDLSSGALVMPNIGSLSVRAYAVAETEDGTLQLSLAPPTNPDNAE